MQCFGAEGVSDNIILPDSCKACYFGLNISIYLNHPLFGSCEESQTPERSVPIPFAYGTAQPHPKTHLYSPNSRPAFIFAPIVGL